MPAIVRTPATLARLVADVDAIPARSPDGGGRRYVAFASDEVGPEGAATLEAWDRPGEWVRVLGADILAEFTVPFHTVTLSNARIERITGLTTTWRDLRVVRAIAEKWGPR